MQRGASISLNIFRNVSVSNLKETSLQAKIPRSVRKGGICSVFPLTPAG